MGSPQSVLLTSDQQGQGIYRRGSKMTRAWAGSESCLGWKAGWGRDPHLPHLCFPRAEDGVGWETDLGIQRILNYYVGARHLSAT